MGGAQRAIPWIVSKGIVFVIVIVVVVVVDDVVVERLACVWTVLWTRAKNARPTQELREISVGQTTVSADVSVLREIGDICRVVRHVAKMSPTLPT